MSIPSNLIYDRYKNVISFILSEKFLTITVIGSIFTFQFISSLKTSLVDPLLEFALPNEFFKFLNVTLRDGFEPFPQDQKKITMDFGTFFKEFIKYILVICILFVLAKYTRFPDIPSGNITGAAIM